MGRLIKDLITIRNDIQQCSDKTEILYTRLGEIFPSLLSIVADTDPSSSLASPGSFNQHQERAERVRRRQ